MNEADYIKAYAPGRVNLMGDHTDTTGGLALPMAIDLGVTLVGLRSGERISLRSDSFEGKVDLPLNPKSPSRVEPKWGRYVAGVAAELEPARGFMGIVVSSLPAGSGLSSSAALEVATALALDFDSPPVELARLCQRAEQRASGVPCGIMDQLASAAGVAGHALLIDCTTLAVEPVPMPEALEVVVVDSGKARALAGSAYAAVAARCQAAAELLGALAKLDIASVDAVEDESVRAAARHVITENQRVRDFAKTLAAANSSSDFAQLGQLMADSHRSLAVDLGVSNPTLDALVADLIQRPGVYGARLTGAGFGGSVVALCQPGALDGTGRVVQASSGAFCESVPA